MLAIEEDKAEVFACLMMPSQSRILHRWIKDDPVLEKKTAFIKNLVGRFCSEINEDFFTRLIQE